MSIPDSINFRDKLVESAAFTSKSQEGGLIAAGKKRFRLKISDDPRFQVAAQLIDKNSGWMERLAANLKKAFGLYVEIKTGKESSLLVNVNSVAARLHLSKKEVQKTARGKDFITALETRAEKVDSQISHYEKIMKNYEVKRHLWHSKELIGKEGKVRTGLTPALLMKAIRVGLEAPLNSSTTKTRHGFRIKGKVFIAKISKKGELKLTHISRSLGSGGFGEAFIALKLNKGTEQVFKQAKVKISGAKEDLQNEFALLTHIHSAGSVWGIQAKPRKVMEINLSISETLFGFLGEKYDGDYLSDIQKKPSESIDARLMEFHQLLYGLKYLAEREILHGDLKPENIFVKREPNGSKLVHIADLGGARDVSSISDTKSIVQGGAYTPCYLPKEDIEAISSCKDRKKLIELQQKRDVFAMGVILYQALSKGSFPYELNAQDFPTLNHIKTLKTKSVPQEIKDLIGKMLDPDPKKRPSPAEAFKILDTFIQEKKPALHQKIQEKMLSIK